MRQLLKARSIADELMGYFLSNGICEITLRLKLCEIDIRVIIEGVYLEEIEDIEKVVQLLNTERRPELEEEYENLLGARHGDNSMQLLASMIDKASYKYEGDTLILEVIRYN